MESFAGEAELKDLLKQSDIVVCLLPNTAETIGILNAERLSLLPAGASVANVARAGHVVVPDLIAALDTSRLSGAILDVFGQEPLPQGDPLWKHPGVLVTSHLASTASRRSRARYATDIIAASQRGAGWRLASNLGTRGAALPAAHRPSRRTTINP